MSGDADVIVVGIGLMTAVGATTAETVASVRSATARFTETSIRDHRFEPFTLAVVPDDCLPPLSAPAEAMTGLTSRMLRMLRLATAPLQAASAAVPKHAPLPGLVLSVPETVTTIPFDESLFLRALSAQATGAFDGSYCVAGHTGRAGGLSAIAQAVDVVRGGRVPFMLAGGVDTYRDLYVLGTLDMEQRVKSSSHLDGFIPGEGAAILLLAHAGRAREYGLGALATLSPVVTGMEPGHLYSSEVYRGDGLAGTLRALFAQTPPAVPVREVYSSMNGESHWAKEWGVAYLRNRSAIDEAFRIHHPADCYGDLGAACGPALVVLAALGIGGGYRTDPALVYASSDHGARAAVLVSGA